MDDYFISKDVQHKGIPFYISFLKMKIVKTKEDEDNPHSQEGTPLLTDQNEEIHMPAEGMHQNV